MRVIGVSKLCVVAFLETRWARGLLFCFLSVGILLFYEVKGSPESKAEDTTFGSLHLYLPLAGDYEANDSQTGSMLAYPTVAPPEATPRADVYANCTVKESHDKLKDGKVDSSIIRLYDQKSLEIEIRYDQNNDQSMDEIDLRDYNTFGQLERQAVYRIIDGIRETISVHEILYDRRHRILGIRTDIGGEGVQDITHDYFYDDSTRTMTVEIDEDDDGKADYIEQAIYDWHDRLTRYNSDYDADNNIDAVHNYVWNNQGQIVEKEYDRYGDGIVDDLQLFTYDSENRLIEIASTESDIVKYTIVYQYDDLGFLSSRARYLGPKDSPPHDVWHYYNNPQGRVVKIDVDDPLMPTDIQYFYSCLTRDPLDGDNTVLNDFITLPFAQLPNSLPQLVITQPVLGNRARRARP